MNFNLYHCDTIKSSKLACRLNVWLRGQFSSENTALFSSLASFKNQNPPYSPEFSARAFTAHQCDYYIDYHTEFGGKRPKYQSIRNNMISPRALAEVLIMFEGKN